MTKGQGKVWLVGAGPGDAGLLTLKGAQVLREADVVVYDKLVGQEVMGMIPAGVRVIDAGKSAGNHTIPQEEINRILLKEAQEGYKVVRLKGGDPFLFGRGGEEIELIARDGIPFEIVPGVPSAIAVPAYAGIPVTHRDSCSSVHIITGHAKNGGTGINFQALAATGGTLVFLMGLGSLREICDGLMNAGMGPEIPAAILEKGTTAAQRKVISTLAALCRDAEKGNIQPPAVVVVGDVCRFAFSMTWADKRDLAGMRVVNVRPEERNSVLTGMLRKLGAEVVEYPCIKTKLIEKNEALYKAFHSLVQYGWIVLTSPYGAEVFFKQMWEANVDVRELKGIHFAAIGPATAGKIEERGIRVSFIPDRYCAAALGEGLLHRACGQKVLIARAKEGSPILLEKMNTVLEFDDIAIYETIYVKSGNPAANAAVESGAFDYVMFTSASTVRGFAAVSGLSDFSEIAAVCIGEETARQAVEYGMHIWIAKEATLESMTLQLIELNRKKQGDA